MHLVPDVISIPIVDRQGWLELRRQDVTASDIAAVCGVHPIRSALQVYLEKSQPLQADNENNVMRRGRWLEPAVIAAVRDRGHHVETTGFYLRSPSLRIGATPDAILRDGTRNRVLQCKVVSRSVFEGWGGEVPLYYQLQVLTEAALLGGTDQPSGVLAALVISEFTAELEMFDVPWNAAAWERIKRDVGNWWADVTAGRKPRADYLKDADAIKDMHTPDGRDVKERADLTADNRLAELCDMHGKLGASIKIQEAERNAIAAEIIDKLGGIGKAKCGEYNLSYTSIEVPEKIVKAYSFNRLTVSKPKGK